MLCYCQQGNEFQGFTKGGKLVIQLGKYHLLKQCCTLILVVGYIITLGQIRIIMVGEIR